MSHPLPLVRAEIKAWERDFASIHGRDPSLKDIRDNPAIADKYKLYKKLSKAAPNPSTPPRSHSRLPAPKSRAAEPVPPCSAFNPFSPVKKSAKHNHALPRSSPRPNPFPTPAKNNSKSSPRTTTPSPDPFPSILPSHNYPVASSSHGHPSPISRARKRLRGEPVSPSPKKPKRQRTRLRSHPPFPKLDQDSSNSDHEPDQELPHCDFTSPFVADSPVKAPAGGKSFKLLFDDTLPALSIANEPVGSSLAHLNSPLDAGFSQRPSDPSVPSSLRLRHDLKSDGVASGPEHRLYRTQGKISAQIFPPKDHLPALSRKPAFQTAVSDVSQRIPIKRALNGDDLIPNIPSHSRVPLVPPSPPPQDSFNRDAGRAKAKTATSRKKPRLEDEQSDEGMDGPDDVALKIAAVNLDRVKHAYRHADDLDWELLPHLRTRNHDLAAKEEIDANHHAPDTFSVDLPDKFRRVLAISPLRYQDVTEERVVRGLLHGDRVGHYDPSRGGDIWDIGETDEGVQGDIETEDDWEGEPVPWEVGEL